MRLPVLDPEILLITDGGSNCYRRCDGGGNTEVSEAATDILLEAAHLSF